MSMKVRRKGRVLGNLTTNITSGLALVCFQSRRQRAGPASVPGHPGRAAVQGRAVRAAPCLSGLGTFPAICLHMLSFLLLAPLGICTGRRGGLALGPQEPLREGLRPLSLPSAQSHQNPRTTKVAVVLAQSSGSPSSSPPGQLFLC